jgi:hypothetical protein
MSSITLWLNRNIASSYNVLETIRESLRPGEDWRIVTSHPYRYSSVFRLSDHHEVEPAGLGDRQYIRYCLNFIRRNKVNVFLPGTKLRAVLRARRHFDALGVTIIAAADASTVYTLESKSRLYRAVPSEMRIVPDYRVVRDMDGFDRAYAALRRHHRLVCFKPCVSVYGLGFRIVTPWGGGVRRLLNTASLKIGLRSVRRILGSEDIFRPLMLMPYLPGPERSVDCLGHHGELVRAVVRRKGTVEGYQKLEHNPGLIEIVRKLTAHFKLSGLYNVQFRDSGGRPYLLEINPRMSGGLYGSCLSGVAFPYWAIRLAMGTAKPEDVPQPKVGFRIAQVNRAVRL